MLPWRYKSRAWQAQPGVPADNPGCSRDSPCSEGLLSWYHGNPHWHVLSRTNKMVKDKHDESEIHTLRAAFIRPLVPVIRKAQFWFCLFIAWQKWFVGWWQTPHVTVRRWVFERIQVSETYFQLPQWFYNLYYKSISVFTKRQTSFSRSTCGILPY